VSPDGKEYAFIGTYTGTSIIDLNSSRIREIAFIPGNTASYCYREFKTYKSYLYIVSEGGRGVQIVDLSRLPDTSGLLVREFNYISAGKNILQSHTVSFADGYLFLNGSAQWSPGGTIIFSLKNDPTNPQYVGQYQPEYIHDAYIRNDTLYAAAIYSGGGLHVVNIANKANPQLIRKITYTGSGTHHAWASIKGRYAMTTDEIGSTISNLKVWKLDSLGSGPPYTPIATFTANPSSKIHNVHGRGNYAYISHYAEGMYVLDVHNPAAPVQAGFYDSYPGPPPPTGFDGCWGVYPYFPSGRWIGSDMQTGLYLFSFTGLAPRLRSPLVAPANNDTMRPGVPKTFRWRKAANQAEDPHYYELHIWGSGLDTLLKTNDTSLVVSPFPTMQLGQTYRWHVWIRDEFTNVSSRDTFQFLYKSVPRLDTVRHIHPRPGTGLSAIWGYTAPNGREYALVGITGSGSGSTSGGTSIVDITNDLNPRVVTHIVGPNSTWREMKTYKHYAYVVTEASSATGVQIIDLSQLPDTARLVRTFSYTGSGGNINQSHTITITDGFMYLNGCAGWNPGGILIFDLRNDPTNPQFVSAYEPMYVHDSYVLRDTIYASAIYSGGGLIIADARNKANVQTIGRIAYASSGTHNAWVTKDRRYVMTTDEITHPQKNLKIWDIGNLPSIPTVATATFTVDPTSTIHNVHIRGDYAYCAWYQGYGLQIADISNPAAPTLAAGYRTSTSSLAWETYPYFPSGKVIIGDGSTGLWIFRFSELAPRVPVRLTLPVNNDTVHVSSGLGFQWTRAADLDKDPHYYNIHIWGAGLDTTWRANSNAATFSNIPALQLNQWYSWTITTRDEWNTTASPDTFRFRYAGTTGAQESKDIPLTFGLDQNYPNPFNPTTTINFRLSEPNHTTLKVFDLLGREVATIVSENLQAGYYQKGFDAAKLASGIYFYRLQSGGFSAVRRMLLLR
jgi:choice-of-anchor B domain-containing protein